MYEDLGLVLKPMRKENGWLLVIISMFCIGMMVGGIAKNSKIAGVVASALYFPMMIFSGATMPYEIMPSTMQKIVEVLPLTQGIKILKSATLGLPLDNAVVPIVILIVIAVACSGIAIKFFKWD
jgi:ABC-2 type transport system permease protein